MCQPEQVPILWYHWVLGSDTRVGSDKPGSDPDGLMVRFTCPVARLPCPMVQSDSHMGAAEKVLVDMVSLSHQLSSREADYP